MVEGKVVPGHFLTEHHAMKGYWGVEVQLHTFLTLGIDGGTGSASCPSCFVPRERAPGTHCTEGWVGSSASLDVVVRRKIPSPYWDPNPLSPSP